MIRAFNQALFYSLLSILNLLTFSTYTALGNVLTPRKVFTVISLFTVMRLFFYHLIVMGALGMSEVWVSLQRIQASETYMCTHVCVYAFVSLTYMHYVRVCTCVPVCDSVCTCTCVCAYVVYPYACTHTYICMCVCMCMCMCVYVQCAHVCVHVHVHVTCTLCVHMCVCL